MLRFLRKYYTKKNCSGEKGSAHIFDGNLKTLGYGIQIFYPVG